MTEKWVEIEKCIEKAEERLRSARLLFDKEFFDDCISCAYYSLCYGAKAVLLTEGTSTKMYKVLKTRFGLQFIPKEMLEEWRRRMPDFAKKENGPSERDIFATFAKEEPKEVLEKAEIFLTKIKEFLEEVRKGEIEVK
jgi:hypothetical protein